MSGLGGHQRPSVECGGSNKIGCGHKEFSVIELQKLMLQELERRNSAPGAISAYLRAVKEFAQYLNQRPDQLGPDHIRQYQAHLFRERKLQPNTVIQHLGGIRFFYIRTLKQTWSADLPPPNINVCLIRRYLAGRCGRRVHATADMGTNPRSLNP